MLFKLFWLETERVFFKIRAESNDFKSWKVQKELSIESHGGNISSQTFLLNMKQQQYCV